MAIANTGTIQNFGISLANAGTASTTITVASDAELVMVGVSGFNGANANFYSTGSMTFTKGGVDTAMTSATTAADGITSNFMAAVFYLVSPDTGTNKTLKWDWATTQTSDFTPLISVSFWKGIDTASPVRDADGVQGAGFPITTPTLTCVTNDMVVGWTGRYCTAEGAATGWTNLTTLADCPVNGNADGAWGTGSPTGNETVALTGFSDSTDGGLIAVVLQPAADGGATNLVPQIWM